MNETGDLKLQQPEEPKLVYNIYTTTSLPFNVATDLDKYSRIFITKEIDYFRIVHCCENFMRDYKVFGETQDGDKILLFTCNHHFQCCKCCEECAIGCICCSYICCDSIIFQMDYKRNGATFYTQGYNLKKGCYFCELDCCCCPICCPKNILYLRENIDPDSPDPDVGVKKGKTKAQNSCCICTDKTAEYITEENLKGPTVRAACCDICINSCLSHCCWGMGCDFEMSIEDENGLKTGNILIYAGCYSKKVEGLNCFFPRAYFEINMPPSATSEQKFQIIADTIHLDLTTNAI